MADVWAAIIKDWATGNAIAESHLDEEIRDRMTVLSLAVDGDLSTTTKKHRHLSGTLAARPAAGEAGRLYICTDLRVTFLDDGSNWSVLSWNPRYCDRLFSEFAAPGATALSATGWFAQWLAVPVTPGTVNQTFDDHSSVQLLTGAAVGALWHYTPGGNGNGYIRTSGGSCYPLIFETVLKSPSPSVIDVHFGVVNALSTARPPAPTSSIMFRQQDAGNYFTVTQDNGGGETSNDSGVAPNLTNYDVLRIEVYSTSLAKFYINGTKTGTDHTTGIPSSVKLHPGFCVRSNSALQRGIRLDMNDLLYKRYLA